MGKTHLGEFEEIIMLVIASQENEGYAVSIREYLLNEANRKVNISAVHSTLYRLEEKGLLSSYFGGGTSKRGGKNKRLFQVTAAGFQELRLSKEFRSNIWSTIPQLS